MRESRRDDGVLAFVNIFVAGLAAGTFVAVMLAVVPTVRTVTATAGHAFHREFDPRVDRFNPLLVFIATVTAVALFFADRETDAIVLRAIGVAGSVAIAFFSLVFCIPVNRSIARWQPDAIDEDAWRSARTRWNRFHLLRTIASLAAFGCYLAAVLV